MNTNEVLNKLKAEIERLKDEYTDIAIDSHYGTVNANSVVDDLERLLSLTDTLQQEQPEVELEKASRKVYESWKGGTMDDFLRDMVELGKALNATKED